MFKTTNGGGNWEALNAGLTNLWLYDLAIGPATPAILYAGTNGGVFVDWEVPIPCYTLATGVKPGGTGSVGVDIGPNCAGGRYSSGTVVHLTAAPYSGYSFSNWSGGAVTGSTNPAALTMNGNKSVTAHFVVTPPGAFSKSSPVNGASNVTTSPILGWNSSTWATSYEYCIDTRDNNVCDTSWVKVGDSLKAALRGLSTKKAYFWQVRAVNAGGTTYANAGTWWSFKTLP